jgi:predicted ferric reductase
MKGGRGGPAAGRRESPDGICMHIKEQTMNTDTARVVKKIRETRDITSLFIDGYGEAFGKRRAGQFLTLKLLRDGAWSRPHPFTISCAPEDPLLRVTIKKLGEFTSMIPELEEGAPVIVSGPYGLFCKDIDAHKDIVMIAGGVGITPFLSVLRHFRNIHADNRVLLLWSNRSMEDAFAVEELAEMSREMPLRVVHNLSRESEASTLSGYAKQAYPQVYYEPGRCSRDLIRKYLPAVDPVMFLCGPPPMQDYVLGEIAALDMDPGTVQKESFTWKASG